MTQQNLANQIVLLGVQAADMGGKPVVTLAVQMDPARLNTRTTLAISKEQAIRLWDDLGFILAESDILNRPEKPKRKGKR